jgi:hypothetical protein
MAVKTFTQWLETHDIFGFDKELYAEPKNVYDEKPVKRFSLQKMMENLSRHSIGSRQPIIQQVNEVRWGEGPGSLRVWIGTGLNVMFERMGVDLQGTNRWITKKVYQIPQSGYGGHEDVVANEALEVLQQINETPLESATREYNELEDLVVSMASNLRKTARSCFIFEGVRKVNDEQYIIRFSVRGQGVETQDQQRVEEHQTLVHYDKESGLIRLIDYNLESPVGKGHKWEFMQADSDWYFAPNQPREEIIETISNTLYWY